MSKRRWILAIPVGLAVAAVLLILAFQVLPDLFAPERSKDFGKAAEDKARGDVRTSALQYFGGLVVALGGAFTVWNIRLTQERNRIEREGQITDRFIRAIEQLGGEPLPIKLGGIYALERIARNSTADRGSINEVLTAYVRAAAANEHPQRVTADVQAILTVLGRRETEPGVDEPRLELRSIKMTHVQLREANLVHAILRRAHLEGLMNGVHLDRADLRDATLQHALLKGAHLTEARLNNARLNDAHLENADLTEAHLERASLAGTHLEEATLQRAHLGAAHSTQRIRGVIEVRGAHLEGADLREANLEGADLREANLEGADLRGAKWEGAVLRGANLEQAKR